MTSVITAIAVTERGGAMNDKEENVESEPWLRIINVVECSKLLDIADKQEQLGYIQTADVLRRIAKGSDVD